MEANLTKLGEFGLIERIKRSQRRRGRAVLLGIGDDAAVFRLPPGHVGLATTDTLVEGRHFDLRYFSYFDIGWRAMAANLSDIAAMGGRPILAMASLTLTSNQRVGDIEDLYKGMKQLAGRYQVIIAGGDVVRGKEFSITISIIGQGEKNNLGLRSGARPGDAVMVTGALGASAAGLTLLSSNRKIQNTELLERHLRPVPRVKESILLARHFKLHGMIDISDGLASELWHLSRESGVGIIVDQGSLPLGSEALAVARILERDPLEYCLYGGEDFELLLTLRPLDVPRARSLLAGLGTGCAVIGQVCRGRGVRLAGRDGRMRPLPDRGFVHF